MIGTFLGLAIGILATAFVAHYYFKKGRRKSIIPYVILDSNVFAGIDDEDRKKLRFEYLGDEILDLHQLEFLIGNNGEVAISNCIKPLTLTLPDNIKALDASITHRSPKDLEVNIVEEQIENKESNLIFQFPLLNKGDYFIVKLLLSGRVKGDKCIFNILADDLPRNIMPDWLPREATIKGPLGVEWSLLLDCIWFILLGSTLTYALHLLYTLRPERFPIPWDTFTPSFFPVLFILFSSLTIIFSMLYGILAIIIFFLDPLISARIPFSIPEDIVSRVIHPSFSQFRKLRGQKIYRIDSTTDDQKKQPNKANSADAKSRAAD